METEGLEKQGFKPAPADYFSREAFVKTLVAADKMASFERTSNCIGGYI
jgi:hypothetical protein